MKSIITLVALLLVLTHLTLSQTIKPEPAKWTLVSNNITVNAGGTAVVQLKVHLLEGWHTYGLKDYINNEGVGPQKTEITLESKVLSLSAGIKSSKPIMVYDSAFEVNVEKFKHDATFMLSVKCPSTTKAGNYEAKIIVYYATCTEKNCLPAKEVKLPLIFIVNSSKSQGENSRLVSAGDSLKQVSSSPVDSANLSSERMPPKVTDAAAVTPSVPNSGDAEEKSGSPGQEVPKSLIALLLLAMGFGASSWVMPCVYPMIPITVSFFTKRSEKEKTKPVIDSLVYSAGIMSTYIIFGAMASIFFGATAGRDFASLPWVNFFLALLFLIIAGNLFGMYEIALPASLVNALNKKSNEKHGYSASFLMGMVFSLTAFTCTVPFIDLVGKISADGEWFRPVLSMTFYAAVFALPFFLLALFPSVITKLPRSGAWMNNIKVVFGFVEIAFAVSYFARVDSLTGWGFISREVVLSIWAGCSFLIMLYILGVFRMKLDSHVDHVGGFRATLALVFATLTFYVFDGIKSDSVGPLEPFVYVESTNRNTSFITKGTTKQQGDSSNYRGEWIEDLNAGLKLAKELDRPVFVDFTGISCTNCRWMEKNMFSKPPVKSIMDKMILVRAYTDRRYNPQDRIYQQMEENRFQSTLLPLYVLLTAHDKFIASSTYTPVMSEFIEFLKKAEKLQTASK